jgi:hypothetical protein
MMSSGYPINYGRVALAALGAFVVYFIVGGITFTMVPSLVNEFRKYPAVYRSQDSIKEVMPFGMAAMFVAILAIAVLYALMYRGGSGLAEGARFGVLIGIFAIGSFVIHNYVNLNIGLNLTCQQAVAYFIEWVLAGIAIGLIYRPAAL